MPVLYLVVRHEDGSMIQDMDTVYKVLVPEQSRLQLSGISNLGALTMTVSLYH